MQGGKPPRFFLASLLILAAVCLAPAGALAGGVIDAGFCLQKSGRDCTRRVQHQATLSIGDLPTDDRGRPILYFYSLLEMDAGEVLLHAWERGGESHKKSLKPWLFVSERSAGLIRELAPDLERKIQDITIKLGKNLFVVPVVSRTKTSRFSAFSYRVVTGPGIYVASVVDGNGQPIRGSKVMEVKFVP